jgi:metal-responsive CopG/Arc/MetJ family transcriptional regulator
MNEVDYKNLLTIYQQKSSDLFTQTIALESRIITSNQIIESLSNKVNELTNEIEKLKGVKSKKSVVEKSDSWEE